MYFDLDSVFLYLSFSNHRPFHHRRCRACWFVVAWFVYLVHGMSLGIASEYELRPELTPGQTSRVKVVVEISGDLIASGPGVQKRSASNASARVPFSVEGQLLYDERITPAKVAQSVRHYHDAEATFSLRSGTQQSRLREARRLVVFRNSDDVLDCYSPAGLLTRDELDLVLVSFNSLAVDELMPMEKVEVGQEWGIDNQVLSRLLNLHDVSDQSVKIKLLRVQDGLAKIKVTGSVRGVVNGAITEIDLMAKLNFGIETQRTLWLAMSLEECRQASHADAGFQVTQRLRMLVTPNCPSPYLTDEALPDLGFGPSSPLCTLEFTSVRGDCQINHERRWHVTSDRRDLTVLKMIDRGDLIAQCNITHLNAVSPGHQIPLSRFQGDVQKALGGNLQRITEVSEDVTKDGVHILRVTALGLTSGVPIQWIYYHLTDLAGNRMSSVFTLDSNLKSRFAAADRLLMKNFAIVDTSPAPPIADITVDTAESEESSEVPDKSALKPVRIR